tara:strand:+ start:52 stop:303 length:252 start_codon:yes stop_codon:yes gene_type:complete
MKNFYSQQGEDLLIYRNFINLSTNDGIFLELGAYDGLKYSNTLFFEKYLVCSDYNSIFIIQIIINNIIFIDDKNNNSDNYFIR